ncbi:recombinase family protein [Serratia marcescens]|uniref:recombinase family protein n=1 Tax=Serratia marcescens TaxID=615 RepID=UPI0032EF6857
MLVHLRSGDVLTVTRLDRLARNTHNLIVIAGQLQGAGLRSLAEVRCCGDADELFTRHYYQVKNEKSPQLRGLREVLMLFSAGLCRIRDHSHITPTQSSPAACR